MTCFLAVWELQGVVVDEIGSPHRNTAAPACIVEVSPEFAVPWTRPATIDVCRYGWANLLDRHQGKFFVLHRDGTIELRRLP